MFVQLASLEVTVKLVRFKLWWWSSLLRFSFRNLELDIPLTWNKSVTFNIFANMWCHKFYFFATPRYRLLCERYLQERCLLWRWIKQLHLCLCSWIQRGLLWNRYRSKNPSGTQLVFLYIHSIHSFVHSFLVVSLNWLDDAFVLSFIWQFFTCCITLKKFTG